MTTRMQITLDPSLHRQAVTRAADQGISLAELVRRLLVKELDGPEQRRPTIADIAGIGDSGGSNVRLHKDRYLGEAIAADKGDRPRA